MKFTEGGGDGVNDRHHRAEGAVKKLGTDQTTIRKDRV